MTLYLVANENGLHLSSPCCQDTLVVASPLSIAAAADGRQSTGLCLACGRSVLLPCVDTPQMWPDKRWEVVAHPEEFDR